MATISSLGIGSGLDAESIVTKLTALEKAPLQALESKATLEKAQISAFGEIKSQFAALSDVANRIASPSVWVSRTASSSNTAAATITATDTAAVASFTLDVDALAQKQETSSRALAAGAYVGAGTLTISLGSWTGVSGSSIVDSAAVAAAQAAVPLAQAALDSAQADLVAANAAVPDPSDLDNANASLLTAQSALDTANADLTQANADLLPFTSALTAANATLTSATNAVTAADTNLTSLQSAANAADQAYVTAQSATVSANGNLDAATTASDAATSAASAAMVELNSAASALTAYAVGTPVAQGYANAYTAWVGAVAANDHVTPSLQAAEDAALSAKNIAFGALGLVGSAELTAANQARDNALLADSSAASALEVFAGTSTLEAVDYSLAYTAWVNAVAANDHSTPSLQAAEAAALVAKNDAYAVLGATDPAVQALADGYTAAADSTDASSLIGSAITAASNVVSAQAVQTTAAGLTATADLTDASALKGAALAASTAKTAAQSAATAASGAEATALTGKVNADAAVLAASNTLTNATNDQVSAQAAADSAAQDLLAPTATRDAAQAAVTAATTVRNEAQTVATSVALVSSNAQSAVSTAQTAVSSAQTALTNAQNNLATTSAALPTFNPTSGTSDVAIDVKDTDTVTTLAAKINAANAGVIATAFFDGVSDRLQLSSKASGSAAGFRIQATDTGDGTNNDDYGLSRMAFDPLAGAFGMAGSDVTPKYGADAKARINGVAVSSSTNTLSGNFSGVTITLNATTTTHYNNVGGTETKSPITMAIREDVTPTVKNAQDFITAFNALNKSLTELTKYDVATKTSSLFQGDAAVLGLQSILRNVMGSISGGSVYRRLSDVGIERQLDGSLTMNTGKLSVAANNGNELIKFFTLDNNNAQTNGFALKLAALGRGVLGAGGAVTNKSTALTKELERNATEQTRVNNRAAVVEARLRKQYAALDAKMAGLSALNAYVAQQVTAWNKSTS
ncbi:MAG: flagellar filament capping protein FliD [Rhodoferax sp.]|nr:flagellar filament capping protein FliD [Rhodoferax sp.]MCF8208376.1 flagellar filament capping protein FliD [Rhodoferax sp.]